MQQPGWETPWVLAAGIPAAVLAWWLLTRTASPLNTWRRWLGGIALAVGVSAMLLAAAGLFWSVRGERRTVWVLVDQSMSAGDAAQGRLSQSLRELSAALDERDYIGVITFGDNARVLMPPQPARAVNTGMQLPAVEPSEETWLSAALELAAQRRVPDTEAFALWIGDGHDSAARYGLDLARDARLAGVRLFAWPVNSAPLPEAAIADLQARMAGEDETLLAVDLVLFSTVPQIITPQIKLNGEAVQALDASGSVAGPMRVGRGRTPLRLLVRPQAELATHVLEASILAEQNSFPGNDTIKVAVPGRGDARVLLIHGEAGPERALVRALARAGVDVTSGGPALLPADALDLAQYQALLLCDVSADQFTPAQMERMARFARNGGGLAMIGGPRGFAPGGWFETPVERALPVTCDVTDRERRQTPATLVVLDRSGSMSAQVGGMTKMQLANEGCVRTIQLAPPGTHFGMLSVDTDSEWIVPLGPLRDKPRAVNSARGNAVGGGGIYTDVAMRDALAAIQAAEATSRHIILFSDGNDTERQEGVIEMVAEAREKFAVTVSTICLGSGSDWPFLQALAAAGGGRAFLVEDASQLPAVFSREAALSGGSFVRESPFRAIAGMPGTLTDGVDFAAETTPELQGYVATTARKEAHVWLWADEERERPLLATWHIELGRGLAFTSDARDRWADLWLGWDQYDELWQRWVRWLLPRTGVTPGAEADWGNGPQGPVLTLRFFDEQGNPRELESPAAELSHADGSVLEGRVLPVGSGTYRVQLQRAGSGMYGVQVRERPPGREETLAAREQQVFVPLEELMERPADHAAMSLIARAAGGALVDSPAEPAAEPALGSREVWRPRQMLLWIGAASLLAAIGARRLPSTWRRKDQPALAAEPVLTAAEAMRRVRKATARLEKAPSASHPRAAAAPAPAPVTSADKAQLPVDDGSSRLLSAVRKARKQSEEPGDGT